MKRSKVYFNLAPPMGYILFSSTNLNWLIYLLNIVIDFNAKDFYYHSLKVIIFGRGFWVYSMHILNLIQDSMIYNCAAVFQTHRNGYQKNDSQQDANTCNYFFSHIITLLCQI